MLKRTSALRLFDVAPRANYERPKVEAVLLEIAAEMHPSRLTAEMLIAMIVSDVEDAREVAVARHAINGLREFDLFNVSEGEIVEPTPGALRAVALLCG